MHKVGEEHRLAPDVDVKRHHMATIGQDTVALVVARDGDVREVARKVADAVLSGQDNLWLCKVGCPCRKEGRQQCHS